MAIKKHDGINQTTGRLKKGWKYKPGSNTPVKAGVRTAKPKAKKPKAKKPKRKTSKK